MSNTIIGSVSALLYVVTGGLFGIRLTMGEAGLAWRKTIPLSIGCLAVLLHAVVLAQVLIHSEGVNLNFFNMLSCTGWAIAVLVLALGIVRPVENLGIVLLPFSALTLLLLLLFSAPTVTSAMAAWPLKLHIIASILAYGLLAMAAVQALLLALQDYRLRHHRFGGIVHGLPPLTTMEALLFQMIGAGFVLLSLALLSGFLFLQDIFAQHLVHKTTLSILAWFVFGILLWGRWRFGWRSRTAVRWTLGGFIVLILAYFGSEMVLQVILQRR